MNEKVRKALPIVGLVIHILITALILMSGSMKAFGLGSAEMTAQMVSKMTEMNLGDKLKLIGFGEMIAAILMFVPRVRPLGVLAVSGFWGGVIVAHMISKEPYTFPAVLLALTWVGAYLRGIVKLPG